MRALTLSILAACAVPFILPAQSPIPAVVPAMTSATTLQAPSNADSFPAVLSMLREMKAANEETLRKQMATLAQLDELEVAANQTRIFSQRN